MTTGDPTAPDSARVLVWLGVAAAGALLFATSVGDPDFFWHLAQGEQLLRTGAVPWTDTLSWSRAGHPVLYVPWLGDALFAAVFRVAGAAGVVALKVLCGAVWLVVLARAAIARGMPPPRAALVCLGVAFFVQPRACMDRPFVLAWLALVVTMVLLLPPSGFATVKLNRRGAAALLAVLLVWTALHATFFLWFALVAAALLVALGNRVWASARHLTGLFVVGAACIAATHTGRAGVANMLAYQRSPLILARTIEAMPLDLRAPPVWLLLGVLIAAVAVTARRWRTQATAFLWAVGGLALLALGLRWRGEAFLLAAPALFHVVMRVPRAPRGAAALAVLGPCLAFSVATGDAGPLVLRFGRAQEDARFPVALVPIAQALGAGRVLNTMGIGGYLGAQGFHVFLDGRSVILFDDAFFAQTLAPLESDAGALAQLIDANHIDVAIVAPGDPLGAQVAASALFVPVAFDACCTLLVRQGSVDAAAGVGHPAYAQLRFVPNEAFLRGVVGEVKARGASAAFVAELERLAAEAPGSPACVALAAVWNAAAPPVAVGPRARLACTSAGD